MHKIISKIQIQIVPLKIFVAIYSSSILQTDSKMNIYLKHFSRLLVYLVNITKYFSQCRLKDSQMDKLKQMHFN